jgi:hypothetical protein
MRKLTGWEDKIANYGASYSIRHKNTEWTIEYFGTREGHHVFAGRDIATRDVDHCFYSMRDVLKSIRRER